MRVLVDECVDWRLLRDLQEHEAKTVKQLGWERLQDGELLERASAEFDVLITVDKDLPSQQNVSAFDIAVIVLRARSTRLADLRKLVGMLHKTLEEVRSGEIRVLNWRDIG